MVRRVIFTASHPIIIIILTIAQTLTICLIIWMAQPSAWFAYILFLIFIGGIIVLFIYITSLASNEKFELKLITNQIKTGQVTLLASAAILLTTLTFKAEVTTTSIFAQILPIFSSLISQATVLIISYLLVTLIVAVKISRKIEGPLRNTIKK